MELSLTLLMSVLGIILVVPVARWSATDQLSLKDEMARHGSGSGTCTDGIGYHCNSGNLPACGGPGGDPEGAIGGKCEGNLKGSNCVTGTGYQSCTDATPDCPPEVKYKCTSGSWVATGGTGTVGGCNDYPSCR